MDLQDKGGVKGHRGRSLSAMAAPPGERDTKYLHLHGSSHILILWDGFGKGNMWEKLNFSRTHRNRCTRTSGLIIDSVWQADRTQSTDSISRMTAV